MIQVIVEIETQPGKRDIYLKAFKENLPTVLTEKGCLEYNAFIDSEDFGPLKVAYGPDAIAIVEKWATPDDLNAHAKAPHMVAYQAKVKEFVSKRVIHLLSLA